MEYKNEPESSLNPRIYKSVVELVRKEGQCIGIGLQSLWNALSRGDGKYENRHCRIQYRQLQ